MTLILKSDTAMKVRELKGVAASSVLSLDFNNKSFIKNGTNLNSLDNVLVSTATNPRGYYTPFGVYGEVTDNSNVASTDLDTFKRGLLIESNSANLYGNSSTPTVKTLTFSSDRLNAHILRMVGTGSLQVKEGGSVIGTVNEKNVLLFSSTETTVTRTIEVTPIGDVSYVAFEKTAIPVPRVTRIKTLNSSAISYKSALVQIDPTLLSELLTNFEGCIVIKQHIPESYGNRESYNRQTIAVLSATDGATNGIFAVKGISSPYEFALRTMSTKEVIRESLLTSKTRTITALNFSKTNAKMYINSINIGESTFDSVALSKLFIGSSDVWSTTGTNYIEEVLLFDRQLTDEEMIEVTSI